MEERTIPATQFKANCLALMEEVRRRRVAITITKRGKPVARLVPLASKTRMGFVGWAKDTATIQGDVVSPIDVEWDAMK